jgi:hypothetical protein
MLLQSNVPARRWMRSGIQVIIIQAFSSINIPNIQNVKNRFRYVCWPAGFINRGWPVSLYSWPLTIWCKDWAGCTPARWPWLAPLDEVLIYSDHIKEYIDTTRLDAGWGQERWRHVSCQELRDTEPAIESGCGNFIQLITTDEMTYGLSGHWTDSFVRGLQFSPLFAGLMPEHGYAQCSLRAPERDSACLLSLISRL